MKWISEYMGGPAFERRHTLCVAPGLTLKCVTRRDGPDGDRIRYGAALVQQLPRNWTATLWSTDDMEAESREDACRLALRDAARALRAQSDEKRAAAHALEAAAMDLSAKSPDHAVGLAIRDLPQLCVRTTDGVRTFGVALTALGALASGAPVHRQDVEAYPFVGPDWLVPGKAPDMVTLDPGQAPRAKAIVEYLKRAGKAMSAAEHGGDARKEGEDA